MGIKELGSVGGGEEGEKRKKKGGAINYPLFVTEVFTKVT